MTLRRRALALLSAPVLLTGGQAASAKVIWLQIGIESQWEYTVNVPSIVRQEDGLTVLTQARRDRSELSFSTEVNCRTRQVLNRIQKGTPIPPQLTPDSRLGRTYLQLCDFS